MKDINQEESKKEIICNLFSSIDDFFILIKQESLLEFDEHSEDIHNFVKLVYEKSYSVETPWKEVITLLKYNLVLNEVKRLVDYYLGEIESNELRYLLNEYVTIDDINFIRKNLSMLT